MYINNTLCPLAPVLACAVVRNAYKFWSQHPKAHFVQAVSYSAWKRQFYTTGIKVETTILQMPFFFVASYFKIVYIFYIVYI